MCRLHTFCNSSWFQQVLKTSTKWHFNLFPIWDQTGLTQNSVLHISRNGIKKKKKSRSQTWPHLDTGLEFKTKWMQTSLCWLIGVFLKPGLGIWQEIYLQLRQLQKLLQQPCARAGWPSSSAGASCLKGWLSQLQECEENNVRHMDSWNGAPGCC